MRSTIISIILTIAVSPYLLSQASGEKPAQQSSEIGFFLKNIRPRFIFIRNEKGQAARMLIIQNGRTTPAKKIK